MDTNPKLQNLLNQSSILVKTQSTGGDEQELINSITKMNDKSGILADLWQKIPSLAEQGDSKQLGINLKALEHFQANPDIRKFLHYFAQSESERGKKVLETTDKKELLNIFDHIAKSFKLANEIDLVINDIK